MKINIIYPPGSLNHGGKRPDNDPGDLRKVKRVMVYDLPVKAGTPDREICSIAWRYANRVDGDPVERQLDLHGDRSMMIGDYVEIEGRLWRCRMAGWEQVDKIADDNFLTAITARLGV